MSRTWITSDQHFGHAKVIEYESRPFHGVEHMNEELTRRWNNTVKKNDIVYHLGDISFNPSKELIDSLNGRKRLVMGNHDKKSATWYRNNGFEEVFKFPIIIQKFIILSHAPMYMNDHMPYLNIHGHTHGTSNENKSLFYNACVEVNDYRPVLLDEILDKVRTMK